jgi:hypothetical protein
VNSAGVTGRPIEYDLIRAGLAWPSEQHVRVRFDAEIGCNGCSLDRKPLPQRKGFALSTASSPKLGCDPRHTAGAIVVFNTSARQAYA